MMSTIRHSQRKLPPIEEIFSNIDSLLLDNNSKGNKLKNKIETAVDRCSKVITDLGTDRVYCAFNGGKDALVVLFIFLYCRFKIESKCDENKDQWTGGEVLYFYSTDEEFPCMTEYVESLSHYVNVVYTAYSKLPAGLWEFHNQKYIKERVKKVINFDNNDKRSIETSYAIIMGTRSTDPFSNNLDPFTMTDGDYPEFLRIHPVLDWTYGEIWEFIDLLRLPYVKLYDQGYSSIGSRSSTFPNPLLVRQDGSFKPAAELNPWCEERAGRIKKKEPEEK